MKEYILRCMLIALLVHRAFLDLSPFRFVCLFVCLFFLRCSLFIFSLTAFYLCLFFFRCVWNSWRLNCAAFTYKPEKRFFCCFGTLLSRLRMWIELALPAFNNKPNIKIHIQTKAFCVLYICTRWVAFLLLSNIIYIHVPHDTCICSLGVQSLFGCVASLFNCWISLMNDMFFYKISYDKTSGWKSIHIRYILHDSHNIHSQIHKKTYFVF